MTIVVDVIVPMKDVNGSPVIKRLLRPQSEHRNLFTAKSWLCASAHTFRSWLLEDEPYLEAWFFDASDDEPVWHERYSRDGFGAEGHWTLGRAELRAMRALTLKNARAAARAAREAARAARASSPPSSKKVQPKVENGHANGHTNGHANGGPPKAAW